MPATFVLISERVRGFAVAAVMKAKAGMQVRISQPDRTLEQNARIHAMLTDISDQIGWPLDTGEIHDLEWWKRRTTFQWLVDSNESPEIITPLEIMEGDAPSFAILLPHTSHLSVPQCAAYIEWLFSFGTKNGVVFKEPEPKSDGSPEPPPPEDWR